MITCHIKYIIDPEKLAEFEHYGQTWIHLVNKMGGQHLGYFLPHEGANNVAYALFNFPSLARYEEYRMRSMEDEACQQAFEYARRTQCIISYERSFMRPLALDE